MAKSDQDVEKHVSRGDLEKLIKAGKVCGSETSEARSKLAKVSTSLQKKGLNTAAFKMVERLYNMDQVRAAHILRAFELYVDLLGLNAQLDLEDVIDDGEDEPVRLENGRAKNKDAVKDALKNGGAAALKRFRVTISGLDDVETVQAERNAMLSSWPELEAQIVEVSEEILQALHH